MNALHERILELLTEIDIICKKYNITYYSAGGTTIGAVRHRGFIPWDDDADLYMTRDNFYKFREAFKKEKPEGRVLGCLEDNKEYPGTIPRYIDDTSTIVAKFHCLNTCSAGVVIDIFILDPVPSDPILIEEHIGKLNIYADMVMPYYGYTNRANDKYLELYTEYSNRANEVGKAAVIEELEKDLFSYEEAESEYYVLRWATLPHVFKKDMFGEPVYFEYENMNIPCPQRWYDYLVKLYGPTWMYIPVHIEDESHDFIVDIDHKYTNYLIDADRFIPKDKALATYLRRKELFIKKERLTRPLKNKILISNIQYILCSQDEYIKNNNFDIEELYENNKYDQIVKVFQKYLDFQFSNQYIGSMNHANQYRFNNKIFIPLKDEWLKRLIESLALTGQLKKARLLMDLWKEKDKKDKDFEELDDKIELIYEIIKSFYMKDYVETDKLVTRLDENTRYSMTEIQKIVLQLKLLMSDSYTEIQKNAVQLEKDVNSKKLDCEYVKILGDYYFKMGELEQAKKMYEQAIPSLTNGIMLLDIQDKFDLAINYDTPININKQTRLQAKQFELLSEIDQLCRDNNISYILMGDTFLYGYFKGVFGDEYKTNTIAMTPENALKFIEVFNDQKIQGRNLDYSLTNPLHNGHTIYYCDSNTLSFSWNRPKESKNIGIHITIYIMKKKDKNSLRWYYVRGLDALQTINSRAVDNKFKRRAKRARLVTTPIIFLIGKKRLAKWIFNGYIRSALKNEEEDYYLAKNNYKRSVGKHYKKEYLENTSEVEIYNKKFLAPENLEGFITDMYGKYAEDKVKIRQSQPPVMQIADCDMTYQEFEKSVDMDVIKSKDWQSFKEGIALNPQIKTVNKKTKRYWDILLRSEDRFKLFLEYEPLKDEIIEAFKNEDYKYLEKAFLSYDKKVRKNLDNGLGLCFDTDIFEIYCAYLDHNGERKIAAKLKKKIPVSHKEKIVIV